MKLVVEAAEELKGRLLAGEESHRNYKILKEVEI
jgi:hypothetical protein